MKFKELFYGIGLKPPVRNYPIRIETFSLPEDGEIQYAQWCHPSAVRRPTRITQSMVNELRTFLQPGDMAIDIGAHCGDTSIPLGLAVGPTGCVLALEPNPYAFHVLLANAGLNRKKTNIHAGMFAATADDGEYVFGYSDAGFCNGGLHPGIARWRHAHFFELRVQGRNLSRYLAESYSSDLPVLRYIKTDTEGADAEVMRSLEGLIQKYRPFVRTEIYKHTPESERVQYLRYLRGLGYALHYVESEENFRGDIISDSDVMRWSHFDVFAVPE